MLLRKMQKASFEKKVGEFLNNFVFLFLRQLYQMKVQLLAGSGVLAAIFQRVKERKLENIGKIPIEFHVIRIQWQHVSGILRGTFCGMMMRIVNNDGGFSVMVVP